MKHCMYRFLALCTAVIVLSACAKKQTEPVQTAPTQYTVTFIMDGLAPHAPSIQQVRAGDRAVPPVTPPLFKQEPDGTVSVLYWTRDSEGQHPYWFSEPVNTDLSLYAHFGAPRIFDIQGTGHESPLKNKKVKDVRGLVTAIAYSKGKPAGFYMQDEAGDGNPITSDALYVYCGAENFPLGLHIGDFISVNGTVTEFAYKPKNAPLEDLSVTQISTPAVKIISSNHDLPAPIALKAEQFEKPVFAGDLETLNPQAEAIDWYESLEGMRICVANPKVIAVPYKGTHYIAPADSHDFSLRGGMMYNGYKATARLCLYPARCFADSSEAGVAEHPPSIGDSYSGTITGVLGYAFGNYQIEPTEPLPPLSRGLIQPEVSTITDAPHSLSIAAYNLENFSYGNTKKSRSSKKTAVERAALFADQFVTDMKAPDLICLIEVQDDSGTKSGDGIVSARKTLALLIEEMEKRQSGLGYKALSINPSDGMDGGAPGANIRCAYLYRSSRIELVPDRDGTDNSRATTKAEIETDGSRLIQNPARIGLGNPAFKNTRKSLVAHFRFTEGINAGKDFFVITNHLSSKRGDGKMWGRKQPVSRSSEVKRHQQAEAITAFIGSITAVRPDAVIISVGDYNDFWFSKTIDIFKAAGMKNAIESLPENDRYTYIYDGYSQTLDNILVTRNVRIETVDILHINAELPHKERISDHDPVFVQLNWDVPGR